MKRYLLLIFIIFIKLSVNAQTLGGKASYQFLKLSPSPQISALGGMNISNHSEDLNLTFNNPAILSDKMHSHLTANFNSMYSGISNYSLMQAYTHPKIATNFALGIIYLNYGNIVETDAAGNLLGALRPRDFSLQLSASRKYLEKWHYGATLKYIGSNYGIVRSSAIATDVGISFHDSSHSLRIGLVASNMGLVLKPYQVANTDELPFDLVIGISKKLEKAPVQFSLTAHHLHRFDILYDDTTFNMSINADNASNKKITFEKLFQHFVFSTQIMIGKYLEISAGYNFLRRRELKIYNVPSGLVGFSLGAGALFPKFQVRYARTYFQNTNAYNQLGINLPLNKFIGFGKWGEKAGW
jgi:hypothetical protein